MRAWLLWMAIQTVQPPDSPGSGLLAYSIVAGRQAQSLDAAARRLGRAGARARRLLEEHGATLSCGKRVVRLVLEGGRCAGVETEDGERYLARQAVLSTIHVKHLVEMAPARGVGRATSSRASTSGAPASRCSRTYYATTEPPLTSAGDGPRRRLGGRRRRGRRTMLAAGRDVARGQSCARDAGCSSAPTVADPGARARGQHTLKVIELAPCERRRLEATSSRTRSRRRTSHACVRSRRT